MRLVITEPSLMDHRGHHYSLTSQISRAALNSGLEVCWLTHRDFKISNDESGIQVRGVFSSTMYDRFRPETKDTLPEKLEEVILAEFILGLRELGVTSNDHVLIHTCYGDLFRGLLLYMSSDSIVNAPSIHICTPYDLDTMPGQVPGLPLKEVFRSFRRYGGLVDKKVFFWAETCQLATYFTQQFGLNFRALPLPPPTQGNTSSVKRLDEPFVGVYLGAAREEKGFLELPDLFERLYEPFGRNGLLKFKVQCTAQIVGYQPKILAAINRLKDFDDSYVDLIEHSLEEDDYHQLMQAADVLLLLYDRRSYHLRGSGIAVEAICADKCILTRRDTFCSSLIVHGGGAAVDTIDEASEALVDMIENRERYSANAARQGSEYRSKFNSTAYVTRLLNQSLKNNLIPFYPSTWVGKVAPPLLRI